MKVLVFKYSTFLFLGHLLFYWLLFHAGLEIPLMIPGTPINILGLLSTGITLLTLIILNKELIVEFPASSLGKHVILGTFICFLAELIFQILRTSFVLSGTFGERWKYFVIGVISVTVFSFILSFFVAFQLKTRKTKLLLVFIIIFCILFNFLEEHLLKFTWE